MEVIVRRPAGYGWHIQEGLRYYERSVRMEDFLKFGGEIRSAIARNRLEEPHVRHGSIDSLNMIDKLKVLRFEP